VPTRLRPLDDTRLPPRVEALAPLSTQMGGEKVGLFRPRFIFRPETIVPNFDLSTSNRS
jgi:hypothetical protein